MTTNSDMGRLDYAGRDGEWGRCVNDEHERSLETAIEACTSIINSRNETRSYLAGALWYRSKAYEDQGQRDLANTDLHRAIEIYDLMIEADQRDPSGYANRASVNSRLENYDAALADYDHAISLDSNFSAGYIGRGQILFRRGDFSNAMTAFDSASRIAARQYGTNPGLYSNKCAVRAAARVELDAGRRFCDRAVRNSGASSWSLTSRGYFRLMQGDLEGAAADFGRAVERDEYYAPALYGRGVIAARQGREAEGQADMTRALEMNRQQVEYYANAGLRP